MILEEELELLIEKKEENKEDNIIEVKKDTH